MPMTLCVLQARRSCIKHWHDVGMTREGRKYEKASGNKMLLVSLSLVLLVSCGKNSSTRAESAGTEVEKSVSSSQPVEPKAENAYEKFRKAEKENVI